MDPSPSPLKENPKAKLNPTAALLPFSNGAAAILKKRHPPPPTASVDLLYRECLRNHAASLGGHALDGCGEFMPSPASDPTVPASLLCVACGCHRNFHRRLPNPLPLNTNGRGMERGAGRPENDDEDEDEEEDEEDEEVEEDLRRSSVSPQPPLTLYASAPHVLMALSAGLPGGSPVPVSAAAPQPVRTVAAAAAATPRKRSRTKFRPEQKEQMMELSERLGWRMLKRDEGLVEETCREIGVEKGVFKVWMHNNKHNYWSFAKRANPASAATAGGRADGSSSSVDNDGGGKVSTNERVGNGNGNGNGNDNDNDNGGFSDGDGHFMNGSSSSS